MPIRQFKPVTKSSRFRSVADFSEITTRTPEKSLLEPIKKSGGRDNHGHNPLAFAPCQEHTGGIIPRSKK